MLTGPAPQFHANAAGFEEHNAHSVPDFHEPCVDDFQRVFALAHLEIGEDLIIQLRSERRSEAPYVTYARAPRWVSSQRSVLMMYFENRVMSRT